MTANWPPSWTRATGGFHSLLCPWDVCSVHHFHSGRRFQGCMLERAMCPWDHPGSIHGWTSSGPYICSDSIQADADIYLSCSRPRQALYVNIPPLIKPAIYQSEVACLFILSVLAPHLREPIWEPTTMRLILLKTCYKRNRHYKMLNNLPKVT